jgi:hypothetical protein
MRLTTASKLFISQDSGNVGMIFAAMVIPIVMLIGGAVDYGVAVNKKTLLQGAADAATLAAAKLDDDEPAAIISAATEIFRAKVELVGMGAVEPAVSFVDNEVRIRARTEYPTAFMKVASIDELPVEVYSAATKGWDDAAEEEAATWGKLCMLALDPNISHGLKVQGSKVADLGTCWAYVNSDSSASVQSVGNSYEFRAGGVCTVGLTDIEHNNFYPSVRPACDPVADPFASVGAYPSAANWTPNFDLPEVASMNCIANNLRLKKGRFTLEPGRYCGGLEVQANAQVTFNGGVYIVDNGTFTAWSGARLTGDNVVFYQHGFDAIVEIQGGAIVDLTGRHAGETYQGFLFIQHAEAAEGETSTIQGSGTFNMEGIVYMPTQKLEMGGNGNMNGVSDFFIVVAKNFEIFGSGHLFVKAHSGASPLPDLTPDMPNLDAQTTRLVQ